MGNTIQKLAFPVPDPPTPLNTSLNYKLLTLKDNHKIPVLYLPYPGSDRVLIFSHQNATDLGQMADYLKYLRDKLHISIVGYEYLGYGHSKVNVNLGTDDYNSSSLSSCMPSSYSEFPSEDGCYKSLWGTYQWVRKDLKFPSKKIILMGQSIGSGPTCEVASKVKCGGVILVTPFTSAAKVVTEKINYLFSPLGYFVDFFQNDIKIGKIKSKVFIIHGTEDEVVPWDHSKTLVEIFIQNGKIDYLHPPLWINGATHNDIVGFSEFLPNIYKFLH